MATSTTSTTNITTADGDAAPTISAIHPDILQTHILPHLDGFSLTSLSCTVSYLKSISTVESLWRDICISTWPSINHPRVQNLITSFRHGHRSFFSDCFPLLSLHPNPKSHHDRPCSNPPEIILAVDVFYQNKPIFSKVREIDTTTGWFEYPPFGVDLLDPKENLRIPIEMKSIQDLEENLTLSWIFIDPTRKRAVNLSSFRRVTVEKQWLTSDIRMTYATILAGDGCGSWEREFVDCKMVVTCDMEERGMLHLKELCMRMEDLEGNCLTGKDSLGILMYAAEYGNRERGDRIRKTYNKEYLELKRQRRKRKVREGMFRKGCVGIGIVLLVAFYLMYLVYLTLLV